ncbi:unnamed protein product, partial [Discosporangium mesarthrocarpum]
CKVVCSPSETPNVLLMRGAPISCATLTRYMSLWRRGVGAAAWLTSSVGAFQPPSILGCQARSPGLGVAPAPLHLWMPTGRRSSSESDPLMAARSSTEKFTEGQAREVPEVNSSPQRGGIDQGMANATKRKVALVVGYVGTDFHGFQLCTDGLTRTVEGTLEEALWKAGTISDSNHGDLSKIGWGRTSRTDKGVHAGLNVVAVKLLVPQDSFTEDGSSEYAKRLINEQLPPDVRVFSVNKVPKSFRGREECTLRVYSYFVPKKLLPHVTIEKAFRRLVPSFVGLQSFHNFASMKSRSTKIAKRKIEEAMGRKAAAAAAAAAAAGQEPLAVGAGQEKGLRGGVPLKRQVMDWRNRPRG